MDYLFHGPTFESWCSLWRNRLCGFIYRWVQERQKRRTSFKSALNDVLRAGLDALHAPRRSRQPFKTKGFDLGPSLVGSLDNVEEVLSRAEGEDRR